MSFAITIKKYLKIKNILRLLHNSTQNQNFRDISKIYLCWSFLSIQNCFMISCFDIIYLYILYVACVCVQV